MKITNIYAVGRNYAAHAQEMGNKVLEEPIFFQKSSASLSDDSVITLPRGREIHHELEIVTSIGKGGNNIQVDDAGGKQQPPNGDWILWPNDDRRSRTPFQSPTRRLVDPVLDFQARCVYPAWLGGRIRLTTRRGPAVF